MEDCIFCKIRDKKIPADIVYESDNLMAFSDISPSADVHLLIVPKKHIQNIKSAKGEGKLLSEVYEAVDFLVEKNQLGNDLYRVLVNGGKAQKVPHLHFHFLGGKWNKFV